MTYNTESSPTAVCTLPDPGVHVAEYVETVTGLASMPAVSEQTHKRDDMLRRCTGAMPIDCAIHDHPAILAMWHALAVPQRNPLWGRIVSYAQRLVAFQLTYLGPLPTTLAAMPKFVQRIAPNDVRVNKQIDNLACALTRCKAACPRSDVPTVTTLLCLGMCIFEMRIEDAKKDARDIGIDTLFAPGIMPTLPRAFFESEDYLELAGAQTASSEVDHQEIFRCMDKDVMIIHLLHRYMLLHASLTHETFDAHRLLTILGYRRCISSKDKSNRSSKLLQKFQKFEQVRAAKKRTFAAYLEKLQPEAMNNMLAPEQGVTSTSHRILATRKLWDFMLYFVEHENVEQQGTLLAMYVAARKRAERAAQARDPDMIFLLVEDLQEVASSHATIHHMLDMMLRCEEPSVANLQQAHAKAQGILAAIRQGPYAMKAYRDDIDKGPSNTWPQPVRLADRKLFMAVCSPLPENKKAVLKGVDAFLEEIMAEQNTPNSAWRTMTNGRRQLCVYEREVDKMDGSGVIGAVYGANTDGTQEDVQRGKKYWESAAGPAKSFVDDCKQRSDTKYKMGPVLEAWAIETPPGSSMGLIHPDGDGIVNVAFMLTPGLVTMTAPVFADNPDRVPQLDPKDFVTSQMLRRKAKKGDMYAFDGIWPHRDPGHSMSNKQSRIVFILTYGFYVVCPN